MQKAELTTADIQDTFVNHVGVGDGGAEGICPQNSER